MESHNNNNHHHHHHYYLIFVNTMLDTGSYFLIDDYETKKFAN